MSQTVRTLKSASDCALFSRSSATTKQRKCVHKIPFWSFTFILTATREAKKTLSPTYNHLYNVATFSGQEISNSHSVYFLLNKHMPSTKIAKHEYERTIQVLLRRSLEVGLELRAGQNMPDLCEGCSYTAQITKFGCIYIYIYI